LGTSADESDLLSGRRLNVVGSFFAGGAELEGEGARAVVDAGLDVLAFVGVVFRVGDEFGFGISGVAALDQLLSQNSG